MLLHREGAHGGRLPWGDAEQHHQVHQHSRPGRGRHRPDRCQWGPFWTHGCQEKGANQAHPADSEEEEKEEQEKP